jgi:hypothetical protein
LGAVERVVSEDVAFCGWADEPVDVARECSTVSRQMVRAFVFQVVLSATSFLAAPLTGPMVFSRSQGAER